MPFKRSGGTVAVPSKPKQRRPRKQAKSTPVSSISLAKERVQERYQAPLYSRQICVCEHGFHYRDQVLGEIVCLNCGKAVV